MYRCARCLLKFRHPVPDPGIYKQLYDNEIVSTWPSDAARTDWGLITNCLHQQLPQGGRVLDFGCYSGGLLGQLGLAYDRYGVEINHAAARIAAEKHHGHIWPSIDKIHGDMRFDAVIVSDVIEHMVNPMETLKKLESLLADRGTIIITTGDADNCLWNRFGAHWWYCFYPEHISFISKAWLNFLSSQTGLSVRHCETFRYSEQSIAQRFKDTLLAYCYGWFPAVYLGLGGMLTKMLGRPAMASVPGNGISADHLFIVLAREVEQ